MFKDINLHFTKDSTDCVVAFTHQLEETEQTVFINGRNYVLEGASSDLKWLRDHFPELDKRENISLKSLEERLSHIGMTNIHHETKEKINVFAKERFSLDPGNMSGSVQDETKISGPEKLSQSNTITRKTEEVLPLEFKRFLDQVKNHPAFSGVVTVSWGDAEPMTIVTANGLTQTPTIEESTVFNVMSVGKAFTSIAIMQLVEKGTIKLDTGLADIGLSDSDFQLSDADPKYQHDLRPNPDYKKQVDDAIADFRKYISEFREDGKITIGHLLRHQAGFKDDKDFKGLRFDKKMLGKTQYSNYGYQLLARIISKVSKEEPFIAYIQKHVLEASRAKADAKHAGTEPTPHVCVEGVLRKNGGNKEQLRVPNADGNGCWWMTAADLLKVTQAFSQGKLCATNSIDLLTTPAGEGDFARSACGMVVSPHESKPAILFQGTFEGRSAAAFVVTGGEKPLTVAGVFNSIDGSNFWADMVKIYRGEEVDKPLEGANFSERVKLSKELYKRLSQQPVVNKSEMKEILRYYAKFRDFAADFVPISYQLEEHGFGKIARRMRKADGELRQNIQ